jgi:mRNA interferase MazF
VAARGRGGLGGDGGRGLAAVKRAPRRGDVVWVALDPSLGTEIRKTRPAVVISNDSCNRHGTRVVVLPVTSNVDSLYPGEARIQLRGRPARVLGDQIRSVDKARLRARLGRLRRDELTEVEDAVRITLGLFPR